MTPAKATSPKLTSGDNVEMVIVDDDQFVLELIKRELRGSEAIFRCFSNPEHALEFLQRQWPHIVLIDYRMPRMNGIEFLTLWTSKGTIKPCDLYLCSSSELPDDVMIEAVKFGARPLSKDRISNSGYLKGLYQNSLQRHSMRCYSGSTTS